MSPEGPSLWECFDHPIIKLSDTARGPLPDRGKLQEEWTGTKSGPFLLLFAAHCGRVGYIMSDCDTVRTKDPSPCIRRGRGQLSREMVMRMESSAKTFSSSTRMWSSRLSITLW